MTTPYLRIRNLTKRFGDFTALDDVGIDIHQGEFVCFLGPSGCGKTTLLRAISGLDIKLTARWNRMAAIFPRCRRRNAISASCFNPTRCSRTSRWPATLPMAWRIANNPRPRFGNGSRNCWS